MTKEKLETATRLSDRIMQCHKLMEILQPGSLTVTITVSDTVMVYETTLYTGLAQNPRAIMFSALQDLKEDLEFQFERL